MVQFKPLYFVFLYLTLSHLVGDSGERCLSECCRDNYIWLQTTWQVTLERGIWHGAVTTLALKQSMVSILARTEVRATVLCLVLVSKLIYYYCDVLATTLLLGWVLSRGDNHH